MGHAAGEELAQPHLARRTFAIAGLDKLVLRVPPVVPKPTPEPAVFLFNWLSATGTAILLTALIAGFVLRYSVADLVRRYVTTLRVVWRSLLTIAAMLALGYTTRYSGADAILGLAFAHTGASYPFFAALLGWLGVALTGSDTSSNVLFGSLQKITATRLWLEPRADGGGEQLRRRDGQDDRRAEHRRREHGDGMTSATSGGSCDSCSFTASRSRRSSACSCCCSSMCLRGCW